MYAPALSARFKHKLSLKTEKGAAYMGDVTSFEDSSSFRIASALIMQEARLSDFPNVEHNGLGSFLLGAASQPKIADYLGYLRKHPHKGALVYIDSAGSSALLVPMKENEIRSTGGLDGFRCMVINLKAKPHSAPPARAPEKVAPVYSPIHPSTTAGGFETASHGAEQLAAASHYNDLKRERSSRHLSHIFHLRNLNNIIKTETINSAAMTAKLDAINNRKEVLQGVSVIDFGCGMGGDIFKWFKNPSGLQRYVGVDIAQNSLRQFTERILTNSQGTGRAEHLKVTQLVCADMGTASLTESALPCHTWTAAGGYGRTDGSWATRVPLTEADTFDVASCQFAMHYMFQSAAKAHHFFAQVARHLKPGGVFIATTMDCRVVAEAVSELLYGCYDDTFSFAPVADVQTYAGISGTDVGGASNSNGTGSGDETSLAEDKYKKTFARIKEIAAAREKGNREAGQRVLTYRNDVGSEVLQLKFAEDMWPRLLRLSEASANDAAATKGDEVADGVDESAFGIKYTFTLHDSEEDAAVDAPEWVVPLGRTLRALAATHGLRLAEVQNFQDLAAEMMQNDAKLRRMESMHVFNCKGALSDAEWRIARLYLKLVFVKDSGAGGMVPSSPDGPPPPRSPDGPPPGYRPAPRSPDGPPPGYRPAPRSPDGPPPGYKPAPRSPDGPPPGYRPPPRSPDGPPPGLRLAPRSPDGPPPGFAGDRPGAAKRPLSSYESDEEPSGGAAKRVKANPYESDDDADAVNPFAQPPPVAAAAARIPAGTGAQSSFGSKYGSDSEDEPENPFAGSNPFSALPPAAAAAARPAMVNRYDSDDDAENPFASSNPFGAAPAAAAPAASRVSRYGSDDEESPARRMPSSPDFPPPPPSALGSNSSSSGVAGRQAPSGWDSPTGSPSGHPAGGAAGWNPYGDDEEEDDGNQAMDPAMARLLRVREVAMELCGGLDEWDELNDDQVEHFLERARQQLDSEGGSSGAGKYE